MEIIIMKVKLLSCVLLFVTAMEYAVHAILQAQNTGVDSLSLLQRIFPTQEANWGLLHCREILYQLSSQGSPMRKISRRIKITHEQLI